MSVVVTSSKGQVVIPRVESQKLGLKPGLKVMVKTVNDHIEIYPLPEDPVGYLCGIFKGSPGSLTEALLKDRREDIQREEKKFARFFRHTRSSQRRK